MSRTPAEHRAVSWLVNWNHEFSHRTGTPGDHRGADWLAAQVLGSSMRMPSGSLVSHETFLLDRLDPGDTYLDIDGVRVRGVPVFDAPATSGVTGVIGETIAIATLRPDAVYKGDYRRLREEAAHVGLVIVCQGTHPGLGLLNAEQFNTPYGAPAIHVVDPVSEGRPAHLVSNSVRTQLDFAHFTRRGTESPRIDLASGPEFPRLRCPAGILINPVASKARAGQPRSRR